MKNYGKINAEKRNVIEIEEASIAGVQNDFELKQFNIDKYWSSYIMTT